VNGWGERTYHVYGRGRDGRIPIPVVHRGHAEPAQAREEPQRGHEQSEVLERSDVERAQRFAAHAHHRVHCRLHDAHGSKRDELRVAAAAAVVIIILATEEDSAACGAGAGWDVGAERAQGG